MHSFIQSEVSPEKSIDANEVGKIENVLVATMEKEPTEVKLLFKEANKKCVEAKNQTVAQIPRISDHNKLRTKPHAKNFSNETMILGRMAQTQ